MERTYQKLSVRCNCCVTGLVQAATEGQLKPSSVFTLTVGPRAYYEGKHVAALAMEKGNPFSPYINLTVNPEFGEDEWCLSDEHGNSCGTEGC